MSAFTGYELSKAQTHVLNMDELSVAGKKELLAKGVVYAAETLPIAASGYMLSAETAADLKTFWSDIDVNDAKWNGIKAMARISKQPEILHGKALPEAVLPSVSEIDTYRKNLATALGDEPVQDVDYSRIAILLDVQSSDEFALRIAPFMWQAQKAYDSIVATDNPSAHQVLASRMAGRKLSEDFKPAALGVEAFADYTSEVANRTLPCLEEQGVENHIACRLGLV